MKSPTNHDRHDEFVDLLARHQVRLFGFVYGLCLNLDEAEDLLQQTCAVMWQKFNQFESGTNFVAWACQIARFEVYKAAEKKSRHRMMLSDFVHDRMAELIAVEEERAGSRFEMLAECLAKLSKRDRSMIHACYGENTPVREYAEQIDRSPQSVHNSLKRIRLMLLECVERLAGRKEQA